MAIVDAADVGGELGTQDVTLGRCSKARGSIAQAMAKHGMESPVVLDAWFRRQPREPSHPPPPHLDLEAIADGIVQRDYAILVAERPSPWDGMGNTDDEEADGPQPCTECHNGPPPCNE